ncbi:unnamed protein product [Callosobruchus maculatus]|uniref:Methenyltetrahydrofolate synthase domain-containing protein n=1 Tax=Callosobruchus maculatus TaxID=64391 RepID=A0A653C1Q8_CALMS|nr:unnamed protein product [Callosobruchus maculatus]
MFIFSIADAVTKESIREEVWSNFIKNKIALYPGPYFRIPNFKGAEKAAEKLIELPEFKDIKSVEVNPDKPLEPSRRVVLENGKELYVPSPRIQGCLLKKLASDGVNSIRKIVTRWGIENVGIKVDVNDKFHIDMLVLGSVAVSKDGRRIGKGSGFADIEFAVLKEINAIDDSTIIVTVVHDTQVYDELPKELFKKYDVPVDYIVTPTTIIKVENKLPRPEGIYWDILTETRVKNIDVLQKMKEKHESEGRDTTLCATEETTVVRPKRYWFRRRPRRFSGKKPKAQNGDDPQAGGDDEGQNEKQVAERVRKPRRFSRRPRSQSEGQKSNPEAGDNNENIPPQGARNKKKKSKPIDYSLLVSNIGKSVRVRELKNALIEKGIKPNNITWRGWKGFCYLHYAKTAKKQVEEDKEPFAIDSVIEIIQELKLNPTAENNLNVKIMEPITRIETINITAV